MCISLKPFRLKHGRHSIKVNALQPGRMFKDVLLIRAGWFSNTIYSLMIGNSVTYKVTQNIIMVSLEYFNQHFQTNISWKNLNPVAHQTQHI